MSVETLKALKPKTLLLFSEQMGVMLQSGVPILTALENLKSYSRDRNFTQLLQKIERGLSEGRLLSDIFRSEPKIFSHYYCAIIEVGEHSGRLPESFLALAESISRRQNLQQMAKKALIHPIAVMIVAMAVTYFILVGLVPTFESLFAENGASLPKATQWVVAVARYLQSSSFLSLLFFIFVGMFFVRHRFRMQEKFRYKLEGILFSLPGVGRFQQQLLSAHYAEVLGILLSSGVSIGKALTILGESFNNLHFKNAVKDQLTWVEAGGSLVKGMEESELFSPLMLTMVRVGEESGQLPEMLSRLAELQKREIEDLVDQLMAFLEPTLIVLIGLVIGGIVVALYLPLFSLGEVL